MAWSAGHLGFTLRVCLRVAIRGNRPCHPPALQLMVDETPETSSNPGLRGVALLQSASSRADVAGLLGVRWKTLAWLLYQHGLDGYYKTWEIKKKSGGTRRISAPKLGLYQVQSRLNAILQDCYRPRQAAQGFVRGRNVRSNADPHVNRRFVLNVDLADFFPSIHLGRVRGLFLSPPFECTPPVATVLAQICCSAGSLPIGAPTSPVIANMICRRMDRELENLARERGCHYSRYADDLTISTDRTTFPLSLADVIEGGQVVLGNDLIGVIQGNGFSNNPAKTRLQTHHDRQVVTGVIVNRRANVDRRYIRRIRAMIHAWHTFGPEAAQNYVPKWDRKDRYPGAAPSFQRILRGRIAYLAMIRGHSDYIARRFADQYDNLRAGRDLNYGIDYEPEPFRAVRAPETSERRQLLTVMFTDIVESTVKLAELGDRDWSHVREAHDRRIRAQLGRHRGREIKTVGDAFVATFDSPTEAVRCARSIVESLADLGIEVRIGLHTGEVRREGADIHGIGVVIAARVEAEAQPSEALVTRTVRDLVSGGGVRFEDRGVRELKGVDEPWQLYAAVLEAGPPSAREAAASAEPSTG
jgi:RNA-directed DNA polymerase